MLAPNDPAGYGARGWLRTTILWDWDGAAQDFAKVASIDDERFLSVRANLALALGRLDEALVLQKRAAVEVSVGCAGDGAACAGSLIAAGDLAPDAASDLRKALADRSRIPLIARLYLDGARSD